MNYSSHYTNLEHFLFKIYLSIFVQNLFIDLFVLGVKRNRAEFDRKTICLNRILKYVTR